jgi:hypothetical protein
MEQEDHKASVEECEGHNNALITFIGGEHLMEERVEKSESTHEYCYRDETTQGVCSL